MNTLQTDPLFHRAAPRKAGRPVGARARVIQDPRALGIHHFAFVRSSLLGMDLRESFERYLAWSETTTDLRYVQNRRDALLKSIIEAGRHFDATLPEHAKITHLLDLLRSDAPLKPAAKLPSLEEWLDAEGMDPDAWSEADLLVEYKAHFGLDNADAIEAAADFKDPIGGGCGGNRVFHGCCSQGIVFVWRACAFLGHCHLLYRFLCILDCVCCVESDDTLLPAHIERNQPVGFYLGGSLPG